MESTVLVLMSVLGGCELDVSSVPDLPFVPEVDIPEPVVEHVHNDRRVDFPVEGNSEREIERSIAEVLRLANVDRTGRVRGSVRPILTVAVQTEWIPRGCAVTNVAVRTEALIFVPDWKTETKKRRLKKRWGEAQEKIAAHEETHRDITFETGAELVEQVKGVLAPASTCDELRERVDVLHAIARYRHEWRQAKFDEEHGILSF